MIPFKIQFHTNMNGEPGKAAQWMRSWWVPTSNKIDNIKTCQGTIWQPTV